MTFNEMSLSLSRFEGKLFFPQVVFLLGVFSKMQIELFSVVFLPFHPDGDWVLKWKQGCRRLPPSCAGRPSGSASLHPSPSFGALLTCLGTINSSVGSGCAGSQAAFASFARSHACCGLRGHAHLFVCAQ